MKTDYSTRRWKQHTVKTGIEARYNQVKNLVLTLPNTEVNGLPGGTRSDFVNYNPEGAAYVQDRWEFEGLVLNAGVRYDLFSPGLQVANKDLRSGKRYKQQFSPRLGIAYPVSDKDVLSFHYGWTYQTPARQFVFENRGVQSTVGVRGNPDLEPETNIAYQAGVQHLFSRDISGQFSVFFKDIYGLITVRQERDEFGNLVNVYYNGDYASSRGFETSLIKSFSHKFSAEVNYTFQLATGVASDPNTALQFFNGGRLYLPISEQPLDWDQRHTLSVQAVVRDPSKWGFRILWLYGSGFPFTPSFRNDRRPGPDARQLEAAALVRAAHRRRRQVLQGVGPERDVVLRRQERAELEEHRPARGLQRHQPVREQRGRRLRDLLHRDGTVRRRLPAGHERRQPAGLGARPGSARLRRRPERAARREHHLLAMDQPIGQRGNMRTMAWRGRLRGATGVLLLLLAATAATAQDEQGPRFFRKGTLDGTPDGMTEAQFKASMPEYFQLHELGCGEPGRHPGHLRSGCGAQRGQRLHEGHELRALREPVHERLERPVRRSGRALRASST